MSAVKAATNRQPKPFSVAMVHQFANSISAALRWVKTLTTSLVRAKDTDMKPPKRTPRIDMKAHALRYARMGLAVVPMHTVNNRVCSCSKGSKCKSPGKHPWSSNGVKGATTNRKQIRAYWNAHPTANIGVACGTVSNILALDIDPRNGGQETLRRMTEKLGKLNPKVTSNTGGGGTHYVFKRRQLARQTALAGR